MSAMNGLPSGNAGLAIDQDHLKWLLAHAGVRLEILTVLGHGPAQSGHIGRLLDLDCTRVSKALAELRGLGMVAVEKRHRARIYRLQPCVIVERKHDAATIRIQRPNGNEASVTLRLRASGRAT